MLTTFSEARISLSALMDSGIPILHGVPEHILCGGYLPCLHFGVFFFTFDL